MYTFPFPVPEDLAVATDEALTAVLDALREHIPTLTESVATDETIEALAACRDLAVAVTAERTARDTRATQAAELAAELAGITTQPEPPTPPVADPTPEPTPVVAAGRPTPPRIADVAPGNPTPDLPPDARRSWVTMAASADVPGFPTGGTLDTFGDAARAVAARLAHYPTITAAMERPHGRRRPITAYDPAAQRRLRMTTYSRHSAVEFRRDFPAELRVTDIGRGPSVAAHASSERRLPGGSLLESTRRLVNSGRPITAAAGWCAPSETMWDLMAGQLETLDGILDLPELQSSRGGWNIPSNGGPLFATIWDGIGCEGDTHLEETDVESPSDTVKCCWDIPCPPFEDVRLGVDYVCLTGGLLQRRGYPEAVERFSQGALVALAHKINQGVIGAIVTASGAATVIPADPSGDDAISGLLSAVDLAITDAKYYTRMGFAATMEVVLPMWVLVQMRASGTRRNGDTALIGMTDQQIMDWFAVRRAVPRFVYDWQDSYSGLLTGPGGATPLTVLPTTVDFLVYPAGTWVKAVQDVVNLDTIYDSTRLTTNEYTAIFVEDGWATLQMTPISRLYTAVVDPSGVVGCCPGELS